MGKNKHPLESRLEPLLNRRSRRLQGPDAQEWRLHLEKEMPKWLANCFPPGALVFANNGYGDHLFLAPDSSSVNVFWHEGRETAQYCSSIEDLLPNVQRPPSTHGPIHYFKSQEIVTMGDCVEVKYYLFFRGRGRVTYVPGISPLKRQMERDGLAWVRVRLDDGTLIDSIVLDGVLRRTVKFLGRAQTMS